MQQSLSAPLAGARFRRRAMQMLALYMAAGTAAWAAPQVRVLALFEGKALLEIDGSRRVLAAGAVSPEGVRVVSASSRTVLVEIDGRQQSLGLGAAGRFGTAPAGLELRLVRDGAGGYRSPGLVNGRSVEWLVDTGATSVALSGADADRLGLPWRSAGRPVGIATAQGTKTGHRIVIESLQIGDLRVSSVDAVVLDGDYPRSPLLGMNVLQRLTMRTEGDLLILQQMQP